MEGESLKVPIGCIERIGERSFPQTNKKTFADLLAKIDAGKNTIVLKQKALERLKSQLNIQEYSRADGICQRRHVINSLKIESSLCAGVFAFPS